MTTEVRSFDSVRDQYFIDRTRLVDDRFTQAASYLTSQLLGLAPDTGFKVDASSDLFTQFITQLNSRMRFSREFDHLSMGQIHADGFMPAVLAHYASTLRNNNTIMHEVSPVESEMERQSIDWIAREIAGYDPGIASGAIVTGGTLANLTGLMVAREKLVQEGGWRGRQPATILTTAMAHYSITKAARILAPADLIQVKNVEMVAPGFKIDTFDLREKLANLQMAKSPVLAIVVSAGQTETGLVEPLAKIADIAEEFGTYLHIDAAYGGPFVLSQRHELFDGIHRSQSLTVDPHKYLYTPYPAGVILFNSASDHDRLLNINTLGEGYLFHEGTAHSLGGKRLEGSMGGQGAATTWASIQTLGREGLKLLLDHNLEVTSQLYRQLMKSPFFKPAFNPDLNTICFHPHQFDQLDLVPTARNLLEQRTGVYISTTDLPIQIEGQPGRQEVPVFRTVLSNPYTTENDVDFMLENLHQIWEEITHA